MFKQIVCKWNDIQCAGKRVQAHATAAKNGMWGIRRPRRRYDDDKEGDDDHSSTRRINK